MEPMIYTEYEVIDPVSNKRFVTESRAEAQGYFDKVDGSSLSGKLRVVGIHCSMKSSLSSG